MTRNDAVNKVIDERFDSDEQIPVGVAEANNKFYVLAGDKDASVVYEVTEKSVTPMSMISMPSGLKFTDVKFDIQE